MSDRAARAHGRFPLFVHAEESAVARIRAAVPDADVTVVPHSGRLPDDARASALLTIRFPIDDLASVLERGVEWVHVLGTGVDGFPFDLLGDRVLTCSRGASGAPIAEWAVTMMLAFEKRLPDAWITSPPTAPDVWHFAEMGTLAGRTVALLGLGAVGVGVASRVQPFGARVVALRRTDRPAPVAGVDLVSTLPELLERADHLVIAAPATPRTLGLIGAEAFGMVKPGLHLVNVARGEIVDEGALQAALEDGTVAAASLDTFATEPLPPGHWMYGHRRVRVSPHVSWCAPGALDELYQRFFDNLDRWRRGEPLDHIVDVAEGY